MTTTSNTPLVVHCLGTTSIVRLHGDFGEFAVAEFTALIAQTLRQFDELPGVKNVVVDLQDTDYCGSSALGLFVSLGARCQARGGRLVFCKVSDHLREILRVTELDQLWPRYDTCEEALRMVGESLTTRGPVAAAG